MARSNLIERLAERQKGRPPRYAVADDERLLAVVREVCEKRPANGYRRVTVHVNQRLEAVGERVNPKRIYRLMRQDGLLLPRYTGYRPERRHEGKVITLKSDLRWCSDAFEIRCWNGEAVRVAFSLDCCDREAMSFVATTGGITAEQVRDLMVASVEQRFGLVERLPQPIEWLTDNGSCYTAEETVKFAQHMGFVVCTTPVKSPQSNGMAEAFVKTFKRDYVYLNDLPDALTVMEQLPAWFEDYNERHPHKGLKMRSPRQFRRAGAA